MRNIFEISTPPAVRVVSVRALRAIETSVELDGLSDQTLAEVQHVASRVTDDGAEVLVSIVVETDNHRVTGQAEVPLEWFESQIRMRTILNSPNDISAALGDEGKTGSAAPNRKKTQEVQLARLGSHLSASWNRRRRSREILALATSAWIDLVEVCDIQALHSAEDEMRLLLASGTWSRTDRRRIASFCKAATSRLCET